MKLCLDCLEELFDRDTICPKCNRNDNIINNEEILFIINNINSCNKLQLNKTIKDYKHHRVYNYLQLKESRDFSHPKILVTNKTTINPSYSNGRMIDKQKPTITCPYCQSNDTKKISMTSKVVSTGLFGLASGKIGKQWHCNSCKSDF